jgi:hypothetical protein
MALCLLRSGSRFVALSVPRALLKGSLLMRACARSRLTNVERDAVVEKIATLLLKGYVRQIDIAAQVGISRRRIGALIHRARAYMAEQTGNDPHQLRVLLTARLEHVYGESIKQYEACVEAGDRRHTAENLKNATNAVSAAAKILGLEQAPGQAGTTDIKIFLGQGVQFGAALNRLAVVRAQSNATSLPRVVTSLPNFSDGGTSRQDDDPITIDARDCAADRGSGADLV